MRNNKGFTMLEMLLVLIIAGLIGGVGWYVVNTHNKTTDTFNSADQANSSVLKYDKKDATAKWIAYSSTKGVYSLKYPDTWVKASNMDLCTEGILLLGPDADSVGKCASEDFGQVSVVSVAGDSRANHTMAAGYKDVKKATVKVDGVSGQKMSGTASGQSNEAGIGVLADGTKVVEYVFYTKGRTYSAKYVQAAQDKNVLSDFDLMVTKTLKFSA